MIFQKPPLLGAFSFFWFFINLELKMEIVPQYEDNLISAGLTDSVSMSFSSNVSHLFALMSKNLYRDPKLAAVREIITNAWDAHIDAGCADKPLHIKSDDTTFTIQDFGKGLSKSEFLRLYGIVGESSKRKDNRLTGGMGIGKMAPLSALPYFSVRSHHEGIATTYHISGPTEESGGVPTITEMVSVPTDITGLEVIFPAPLSHFLNNINSVVSQGAIKAAYIKEDGEENHIKTIPDVDVVVVDGLPYGEGRLKLRYGNIVYPITYALLRELNSSLLSLLSELCLQLTVLVEPGKAVVTPNREELVFSDSFKNYLEVRLEEVHQRLIKNVRKLILTNPSFSVRYIYPKGKRAHICIDSPDKDLGTYRNSFALEDLHKYMHHREGSIPTAPFKEDVFCRFNKDVLKVFRGLYKRSVQSKVSDKFKKLLYKSGIKPKNVYNIGGTYEPGAFGYLNNITHPLNTLAHYKKIVIHYRNALPVHARKEDILYIKVLMKTDVDTLKRRLECFLGSEVDIVVWETSKAAKPKQEKKKIKSTEPKKYVSLNSLVKYGGRGAYMFMDTMDKEVENPEVIFLDKNWVAPYNYSFAHWLTPEEITEDKVAVLSARDYIAMMRRKNPPKDFNTYIKEKVNAFLKDPDVLEILQLVPHNGSYADSYLTSHFRNLITDVLGLKINFDDSLVDRVIRVIHHGAYIVEWDAIKDLLNKDEEYRKKLIKLESFVNEFNIAKLKEFGMYDLFVEKLKERLND